MGSVSEILSMGGYGAFVWTAYLIAAVVLLGLFATVLKGLYRNREILSALEAERETRRSTAPVLEEEANRT